ncbi:MAG: DUF2252 domain-containing protein [Arenimonas sp.]|nr:DUF2252 domain-containing protein [Arenimonas sp.]
MAQSKVQKPFAVKTAKAVADALSGFTGPHRSIKQRFSDGKALRVKTARESHASFTPASRRAAPLSILQAQNRTRIQELVPVRMARMLASPFAFLRGSAAVMAADLAPSPVSGIDVQACGDMHVSNFGVYASAERNLVFSINDFDETFPGPWEWDLKRLAASAAVAARFLGGDAVAAENAAHETASAYRKHMREYADMGRLETWYTMIDSKTAIATLSKDARRQAERNLEKARNRTNLQVLGKMTELVDNQHRIIEIRPLIVRETHSTSGRPIADALSAAMQQYLESLSWDRRQLLSGYRIIDVARKVVGVGSVGTRCWILVLEGVDRNDPLMLQYKEAQASVLQPYLKTALPFADEGHRVVAGQRMIQASPDIFLGWGQIDKSHFYIRQLRDMKGGIELIPGKTRVSNFTEYCGLCGWALALAHAKSGDAAMISGYLGKIEVMDDAIGKFAMAYADQTDRDFEMLSIQAKAGKFQVASES